jgi:hypothetical protein
VINDNIKKYMAFIGSKGGSKRGPSKRRGGKDHYAGIAKKRWDKEKAIAYRSIAQELPD